MISPYLGYTKAEELATQRKIFRYWRDRGIDVTSEWVNAFRDDYFVGLQAWTWHGTRASDQGRYGLMWWLFEDDGGYVMSGRENKINAVIPETNTVITVIRYPQAKPAEEYNFAQDKRAMVLFGKRL